MEKSPVEILTEISKLVYTGKSDLHYENILQLLIAVILSAQTTDQRVNMVTPALFAKYPTPHDLANAEYNEVSMIISSLGLYRNKANNLINMAKTLIEEFKGIVPNNRDDLIKLPGVGRKTANVVLSEGFKIVSLLLFFNIIHRQKYFYFSLLILMLKELLIVWD